MAIILWSLETHVATREATHIYHVYKYQSGIVSLAVIEKFSKHQNVLKYYKHDFWLIVYNRVTSFTPYSKQS